LRNRLTFTVARLEVTLGLAGSLSPVGTPTIRAFVGPAPFSMLFTDVIIVRDSLGGVFRTRPGHDVEAGGYVELQVLECISDGRSVPEV
jgi:hypothetical protein